MRRWFVLTPLALLAGCVTAELDLPVETVDSERTERRMERALPAGIQVHCNRVGPFVECWCTRNGRLVPCWG